MTCGQGTLTRSKTIRQSKVLLTCCCSLDGRDHDRHRPSVGFRDPPSSLSPTAYTAGSCRTSSGSHRNSVGSCGKGCSCSSLVHTAKEHKLHESEVCLEFQWYSCVMIVANSVTLLLWLTQLSHDCGYYSYTRLWLSQ